MVSGGLFLGLLLTGLPGLATGPEGSQDLPNIIFFIVDDMGWQDTSVSFHEARTPFNTLYRTPNMARLARQGVLFTQAYASSPVCTPTRASVMTGQNPARTRITNWTLRNSLEAQETGPDHYPLMSPTWQYEGVQPGHVTLPRILQGRGYRTIHAGKAHFGALDTPGADPTNLGFDVNIAGHAAGAPGSFYGMDNFRRNPDGEPNVWDVPGLEAYHGRDIYLTEALTIEANQALTEAVATGRPFYLNMAHYTVHTPIMADSQYVDQYAGLHAREAAYASMIEGMDASLGALLHRLEELGQASKTFIVFYSDNGGLSAHSRGTTAIGTGKNTHNLPLRSGKGSAYEGGIRVPLLISWARVDLAEPAQQAWPISKGARIDTPVIGEDLFATMLDMADAEAPEGHLVDGRSLKPLLQNKKTDWPARTIGWHYPHKWGPEGPGCDPFTAVRKGDWKLIYFYKDQQFELYNLEQDLGETSDLSWKEADTLAAMQTALGDWMTHMDAQTPKSRASGIALPAPSAQN